MPFVIVVTCAEAPELGDGFRRVGWPGCSSPERLMAVPTTPMGFGRACPSAADLGSRLKVWPVPTSSPETHHADS
jgi:hypothetical protein